MPQDRDVKLNEGTGGASIATEYTKYGGLTAHFQLVKPVHGASGTINVVGDSTPWPSVLRGGASNNKLTTTRVAGSNDTLDVNLRGQSGADRVAINISQFAGTSFGTNHGIPIANVGRTGGSVLVVGGSEVGAPLTVTGGTGGFTIRGITHATDSILVHGSSFAYPVGVSLDSPILIKYPPGVGLSAGAPGATYEYPASVAIQGMSGGYLVGITSGSSITGGLMIRGLTHGTGHGYGDSVTVHGHVGAVPVGITAGSLNSGNIGLNVRGLTTGGAGGIGADHVVVHSIMSDGSTGNTLDTRRLLSTTDNVGVTGMGKYGTIGAQIIGNTGEVVGVSGDALKVSITDATISATVNVGADIEVKNDSGNGLYVQGTTTGNPVTVTAASGATFTCIATDFDIRNLDDKVDSIRIVGTTGSGFIGVTAGSQAAGDFGLNIRRTDGGTIGYTGGSPGGYSTVDTIAIQGLSGGHVVGITASGILPIRLLKNTDDSIRVHGATGSYDLGVTAGSQAAGDFGLNVRRLYGGTAGFTGSLNDGTPNTGYINIDTIAIQGICGAYPVGVTTGSNPLMVTSSITDPITVTGGGSGGSINVQVVSATGKPIGASGDSLKVSVTDAVINADVTISSAVEINNDSGNPIPIAGGNTLAMRIEGFSGGDGVYSNIFPVVVAGTTGYDALPVRVAGITGGTPMPVGLSGDVNVRDISGTVSLPTGAAKDETLTNYFADLGNTLGLLGATLDKLINKFPGGIVNVDYNDEEYILPSYNLIKKALPEFYDADNANRGLPSREVQDAIALSLSTLAGSVDASTSEVAISIASGSIKNPTDFVSGLFDVSGTSPTRIDSNSTPLINGINIKGHPRNEDHIWISHNNSGDNGYPLGAGEELFLDIDDLNKIYLYADQTGLTACYMRR